MSRDGLDNELLRTAVERQAEDRLAPVRAAALARFVESGLPGPRHEDWRYTNLKPVIDLGNRWLSGPTEATAATESEVPDYAVLGDAHWVEIRNGRPDPQSIARLAEALGETARVSLLSQSDEMPALNMEDALSSLNAALLEDVLRIELTAGAKLDKPIGLALLDDASAAVCQTRIQILAGERSDAGILEWHRTGAELEHFANVVTEIELGPTACLRYVKIQERGDACLQTGRTVVRLQKDSILEHASIDLGGRLIRNDVEATILGSGASISTSGVYLTHDDQHVDNHIAVDHTVGPATSRQNYRGIASGRSRCVFNGKAIVREGADGTDAEQSNHNLLLSDRAEVDTKPELEIYADDVKCAHGATVGQLDRKALYYLRTRGLDEEQAALMLTRAFAGQIIAEIPVEGVREYVERRIDERLDALIGGEA